MNASALTIICHSEPEGLWAESPDLPGYSATAATLSGLKRRVYGRLCDRFERKWPDVALESSIAGLLKLEAGNGTVAIADLSLTTPREEPLTLAYHPPTTPDWPVSKTESITA